MSKYRHTKSIKNLRELTPEEIEANKRNYILREKLGLIQSFDDGECKQYEKMNKLFLNISTIYKSLHDYEIDKTKASLLIDEGKEIPQDLYNRLVQTKQELDKSGLNINR